MNPAELPPWVQALGTVAVFVAGVYAAIRAHLAKLPVEPVAVANSDMTKELLAGIRESVRIQRDLASGISELNFRVKDLNENIEELRMSLKTQS